MGPDGTGKYRKSVRRKKTIVRANICSPWKHPQEHGVPCPCVNLNMNPDLHEDNYSRRSFLRMIGWGSFFATIGISSLGFIRFLYPNVLFEKPSTFKAGPLDEFKGDMTSKFQVYENWKADQSVWIVREKDRIYAVQAKCTHLGCTPNYFADEKVFKCPCHGSQFHCNGENFAGPAPRPLDRCRIFVDGNGGICVDKSRLYTFKEFDKKGAYVEI